MIWKQFYSAMQWPWLPQVAMALFIGAFVLVLVRTYASRRSAYEPLAALALGDDGLEPGRNKP